MRKRLVTLALGVALLMIAPVQAIPARAQTSPSGRDLGYRPLHPAAYVRAKARANARTGIGRSPRATTGGSTGPAVKSYWVGLNQTNLAPPDPTGAVGPSSYVEMINVQYGIYSRTGSLIMKGTLGDLTGHLATSLSDPQVMWDPGTQRFYFSVLDFSTNTIAWGFSMSSNPTGPSSFCKYTTAFSPFLPDYPKLGDTADFLLIGANEFNGNTYMGGVVDWITKPQGTSALTACPDASTFQAGRQPLLNADGTSVNSPEPAVQTDSSRTGYVVGIPDLGVTPSASYVSVWTVTKDPLTGAPVVSAPAPVAVSSYSMPANAPQCKTTYLLDTSDGRLERAVSGVDPLFGGVAIWTAHAVYGGKGSQVRWYEINPAASTLYQSGAATSTTYYTFNGTIAPDRAVNPNGASFGSNMVLGFNTSAASYCPAIQMVSKKGAGTQSAFVAVKSSSSPNIDFSCGPVCRWGDYSGASPDPTPPAGLTTGRVWLSGEWNLSTTGVDWQTYNWQASP